MQPSLSVARRTAVRASVWQLGAVLLLASVLWLAASPAHAGAALAGGLAMTLGSALSAWLMVGGGVSPAGVVLGRWFLGMVAKWVVVSTGVGLALAAWRLPALPVLGGVVLALVVNVLVATRR